MEPYATARQMLADLVARRISARDLLNAHVRRQEALHGTLNAVVASDLEHAREAAKSIDDARAHGATLGALAGLPMTIKDGYDVFGMPATCGHPGFANRDKSCNDAELVARARKQGAVIWGKTNVPLMLGDFQSYNAIYGTTNNPYDVTRTPGGSSGGAAAALAVGITPLEIGSDIGGSLRHPANFCGVCSLKPSWGVLPMRGHIPPPPGMDAQVDLGVGGPMARNIGDLKLLWDVLTEQVPSELVPAARGRIALWDEQDGWPLERAVKAQVEAAAAALEEAGFTVERVRPQLDAAAMMETYLDLLTPIIASGFPQSLRDKMAETREADLAAVREGRDETGQARYRLRAAATPKDIMAAHRTRQAQKEALGRFFGEGYDAIVMPITPYRALKHDHSEPMNARMVEIDGRCWPYFSGLNWISLATSLHAPSIAVPAGQADGLPVGVQLVGAEGSEDRLFALAAALEQAMGGFVPPPIAS